MEEQTQQNEYSKEDKLLILCTMIFILTMLAFVIIISFPIENKTIQVDCYDRYDSKIQNTTCSREVTCNYFYAYVYGCDEYFKGVQIGKYV